MKLSPPREVGTSTFLIFHSLRQSKFIVVLKRAGLFDEGTWFEGKKIYIYVAVYGWLVTKISEIDIYYINRLT